ncbi:hypothetical protein ACFVW1_00620 [Streptomyces olivochromogenes]|uniref:hypothetical protein n=1 Tax=Streptomyces olivochromogenes TaxID=1963 RepID=UPI0036DBDA52
MKRDWSHGCCPGPAARPPSYETRSWCERLLGRTGTASLAEATALARRVGPPRPSSEDLDHFVERHPGR